MVNEVEDILNEIRERVRADQEQGSVPGALVVQDETVKDSLADPAAKSESGNHESLSRLSAHLTTTARAWDRLPPMFSNRKGGAARVELWIKARLKSMSRWFTWEQVNFNSAVHRALAETLNALSAYEQSLARMRAELSKETEARREQFDRSSRELTALRAGIEAQDAEIRKRDANLEARSAAIEARAAEMAAGVAAEIDAARGEIDAARGEIDEARTEMTSRLAELAGELRESDEQLREEQRVCFKQLSLEASEAMVMGDRGRRVIESRLDKLEKSVSDGEG
jgi:hypothetical protein